MRVGLNATAFNDRPSGARQRFIGIYGALIRRQPDWTFTIFEPTDCRVAEWFGPAPNLIARQTPITSVGLAQRVLKGPIYWPRAFRADPLDLFEDFVLPLTRHPLSPTVLTIHDIRSLYQRRQPEGFLRRQVFRRAFSAADRIIAVSNAVADEITAFHPNARVSTVYNGVDPAEFACDAAAMEAVRVRYGLSASYILTVGHLEERKNLSLIVDAIGRLRDQGLYRPLVIVGNDGGAREALMAQVAALALADRVTLIEHADDATVRALYAGCTLLAFPSRYEGFGIPIVEAMAAARPIAAADTAVFRELTLGQGAYFPVDDPVTAARVIEQVWSNPAEQARQLHFGASRLADFAFDRLADQVADIYRALA